MAAASPAPFPSPGKVIIRGEPSVSTPRQRGYSHVLYGRVLVQAVHVPRRNQHATSTHPRGAGRRGLARPARRRNGTLWQQVPTPNIVRQDERLIGVSASGPNDAWAVGNGFNNVHDTSASVANKAVIEHWNGTAWSIVASPAGLSSSRTTCPDSRRAPGAGKSAALIGGPPRFPILLNHSCGPSVSRYGGSSYRKRPGASCRA